ncbi:MAG TPA: HEAT repeat domain-containing protein [Spirochaetota bacterium]|nr:HEAT repeat domain-containing protein [Spirochaetota bacterium]
MQIKTVSLFLTIVLFFMLTYARAENKEQAETAAAGKEQPASGESKSQLAYYKDTFRFGTAEEQLELLSKYLNFDKKISGSEYWSILALPVSNSRQREVQNVLMDIIKKHKLKRYYTFYEKVVAGFIQEKKYFKKNELLTLRKALKHMTALSNKAYAEYMLYFYTNRQNFRDYPRVIAAAIKGIGMAQTPGFRSRFKKFYYETDAKSIHAALVQALVSYQEEEDISFLENIIMDPAEEAVVKWHAVASLSRYSTSKKAFKLLKLCMDHADTGIRARAVYAAAFFKQPEVRDLLIKAARDDSDRIRYFAIKGMEKHNTDRINELLQYKVKYDKNTRIKKLAEQILTDRGLIKKKSSPSAE